jgi:hypothetical protein
MLFEIVFFFKNYRWNVLNKKNSNAFLIKLIIFILKNYLCENIGK